MHVFCISLTIFQESNTSYMFKISKEKKIVNLNLSFQFPTKKQVY